VLFLRNACTDISITQQRCTLGDGYAGSQRSRTATGSGQNVDDAVAGAASEAFARWLHCHAGAAPFVSVDWSCSRMRHHLLCGLRTCGTDTSCPLFELL